MRATSSKRQPGCPETAINAMSLAHDIKRLPARPRQSVSVVTSNVDVAMNKWIGLALFLAMALAVLYRQSRRVPRAYFQRR